QGHSLEGRARLGGNVATEVVDRATVPLILLGPTALAHAHAARIKLGEQVRTRDGQHLGEGRSAVVDMSQRAIVALVVPTRGLLSRDVLVGVDFIQSVDKDEVHLALADCVADELPAFEYGRIGPGQVELRRGARVIADDGDMGHLDRIESDPATGRLLALWVV